MMHLNDEQITKWMDGELTGADLTGFEAHLSDCAECARLYQNYTTLAASLRKQEEIFADSAKDFSAAIMKRICPPSAKAAGSTGIFDLLRSWFPQALAASCAIAIIIFQGTFVEAPSTTAFALSELSDEILGYSLSVDDDSFSQVLGITED